MHIIKCICYFLYGLNMTCPSPRFVFLQFGPQVLVLFGEAEETLGGRARGTMSQED